jgi:hypothetical protein
MLWSSYLRLGVPSSIYRFSHRNPACVAPLSKAYHMPLQFRHPGFDRFCLGVLYTSYSFIQLVIASPVPRLRSLQQSFTNTFRLYSSLNAREQASSHTKEADLVLFLRDRYKIIRSPKYKTLSIVVCVSILTLFRMTERFAAVMQRMNFIIYLLFVCLLLCFCGRVI